ncbi:MAG: type II toxin-antitoxin system RelE/ParE family toxin [Verrucomicrobiota bacterium]
MQKLGHDASLRIVRFLKKRVQGAEDPRQFGKRLTGDLGEFWRYRVDDYRLLCQIKDEELIVLVVRVGHRREVYD